MILQGYLNSIKGLKGNPTKFCSSREGVILSVGWDLKSVSDHSSFYSKIKIFCKYYQIHRLKWNLAWQGGQQYLHWKFKNSRIFQNMSILFKNISDGENIITIDLKVFLKKLNLIITKDKFHEIQMSTRTKLQVLAS